MSVGLEVTVARALHRDPTGGGDAVSAIVEDGWVTLRRSVEARYQRFSLQCDLLRIQGVRGIRNELVVRPPRAI